MTISDLKTPLLEAVQNGDIDCQCRVIKTFVIESV